MVCHSNLSGRTMQSEKANDVFTRKQIAWMEKRFGAGRPAAEQGYGKGTIKTVAAGLFAMGLGASAFLYSEISSLRDQVQDNRAALARIEAILDERLPRGN